MTVVASQSRHEQDDGAAQPLPDREDEDGRFAERRLAAQPVDIGNGGGFRAVRGARERPSGGRGAVLPYGATYSSAQVSIRF